MQERRRPFSNGRLILRGLKGLMRSKIAGLDMDNAICRVAVSARPRNACLFVGICLWLALVVGVYGWKQCF